MRKTFILLAASAMLLAACNKEESTNGYTIQGNKITFGVGMDNIQGEGKQSYNSNYGRIWFDSDDRMLVNGTACVVNPIASSNHPSSSATHSPFASVTADLSASGAYEFVYPADEFSRDDNGQYSANFNRTPIVPRHDGHTYNLDGFGCLWPMYASIDDLASFHGRVQLRNACAFLSTRFSYGPQWANVVFSPLTGRTYDSGGDTCPGMLAIAGYLLSNQRLAGSAHLDCTNPNYPVMVMDRTIAPGKRDIKTFITCSSQDSCWITNTNSPNITGIIPIAPAENNNTKEFQIMHYTMTYLAENECIFTMFCSNVNTTTAQIKRNNQYMLDINFATAADGTYTYLSGSSSDYATDVRGSNGATIQFSNGTLFVTNNMNVLSNAIISYLQAMIDAGTLDL